MSDMSGTGVVVVGTLNMDLVVRVARRPQVGETVLGTSLVERAGGKGANQASAAATCGPTSLIGCVGDDDRGRRMLAAQRDAGVDVGRVRTVDEVSGCAVIEVDTSGDNRIVVVAGANDRLTDAYVTEALDAADPAVVLTQLESPMPVTAACARWTAARHRRLVLNPSPVADLPGEVLAVADPLVCNELEAAYYLGIDRAAVAADAEEAAAGLLAIAGSAVITLGPAGAVSATVDGVARVRVPETAVSDTTGAGDHFAGVLAALLARGVDVHAATAQAARAATNYLAQRESA